MLRDCDLSWVSSFKHQNVLFSLAFFSHIEGRLRSMIVTLLGLHYIVVILSCWESIEKCNIMSF